MLPLLNAITSAPIASIIFVVGTILFLLGTASFKVEEKSLVVFLKRDDLTSVKP
jgi:hypothetical protein